MSESTPRFTADIELGAIHDSATDLYAPFYFELLALLSGDTPEDIAADFNANPEEAVALYTWAPRAEVEQDA